MGSARSSASAFHLAQVNVGRMRWPIDDPRMAGFVERLDAVNAAADAAPGFVWRLQTEGGDATAIRAFDDELLLVNLSVWTSLDALRDYVYRGDHARAMGLRRQWFEKLDAFYVALWWVRAGDLPSLDEAKARLLRLREAGPTSEAFTFKVTFAPPVAVGA